MMRNQYHMILIRILSARRWPAGMKKQRSGILPHQDP